MYDGPWSDARVSDEGDSRMCGCPLFSFGFHNPGSLLGGFRYAHPDTLCALLVLLATPSQVEMRRTRNCHRLLWQHGHCSPTFGS